MEFLLVLSALLSALTGALTGPRAGETRLDRAEAQLVAIAEIAAPAKAAAERPQQALPAIVRLTAYIAESAPAPALSAPLAFVRLIE